MALHYIHFLYLFLFFALNLRTPEHKERLISKVDIRMINYWLKLVSEGVPKFSSIICSKFSKDMINSCSTGLTKSKDNVSYKWLKKIKQIIDDTGFSYVWLSNDQISSSFRSMFKQKRHQSRTDAQLSYIAQLSYHRCIIAQLS